MYSDDEEKFIGLKVESIFVNDDKTLVVLKTDKGDKNLYVTGDCCSTSWIENMSGVDNLVGHTILSIVQNSFPDKTIDNDYCDVTKFYSFLIKTEKGNFEIEYRNNSNGYYGGDIQFEEEEPYGYKGNNNLKKVEMDF